MPREKTFEPTENQKNLWERWVSWKDGHDEEGWWLGWCPLHDKPKNRKRSAMFNFWNGSMRCLGEPRCHEKSAITLINLTAQMAQRHGS